MSISCRAMLSGHSQKELKQLAQSSPSHFTSVPTAVPSILTAIWDNLQRHNTRLPLGHTTILTIHDA